MADINALPREVLSHILSFLEPRDRKPCGEVCRLWYNLLQGARFQRQILMRINSTFVEPPTESDRCALTNCRNLLITQWDEAMDYDWMYDSTDDEDGDADEDEGGAHANGEVNSEENTRKIPVVEFKYLYQPTPEHNVTELLFGQELKLESLELCTTFAGARYILEDRVQQLQNLTELILDIEGGRVSNPISKDHTFWVLSHDRIRKFKLSYEPKTDNFRIKTPALTTLDVRPFSIYTLPIIKPYAAQLQRLDLHLYSPSVINDLLALQFPCLTCLRVRVDDDRDLQERYARLLQTRQADVYLDEQFIRGMPRLKRMRCESHLLFFRLGAALTRHGHRQLEELKLDSLHFDAVQLQVLQALPRLKAFKMYRCEALPPPDNPRVLPRLYLPHLDELSLVYNESHIAFDRGLVGLRSLKMTIWSGKNHKILSKICHNLPNLEYLRLILNTKLVNTAFRYLNRLTKLRTLRVDNVELTERLWEYCPEMRGVRKLMLANGNLTMGTVEAVSRLFPALNELNIEECCFQNCDKERSESDDGSDSDSEDDDDGNEDRRKDDEIIQRQYEARVRQYFPKCRVSLYCTMFLKKR